MSGNPPHIVWCLSGAMGTGIAFVSSTAPAAVAAFDELVVRFGNLPEEEATVIVALGGDGLMLDVLHRQSGRDRVVPIYGMNRGTQGFLLNEFHGGDLAERVGSAQAT